MDLLAFMLEELVYFSREKTTYQKIVLAKRPLVTLKDLCILLCQKEDGQIVLKMYCLCCGRSWTP